MAAFTCGNDNVGEIKNLELDLKLACKKLVQKNYVTIPKLFYSKVKVPERLD